jgi:hypothetical protein
VAFPRATFHTRVPAPSAIPILSYFIPTTSRWWPQCRACFEMRPTQTLALRAVTINLCFDRLQSDPCGLRLSPICAYSPSLSPNPLLLAHLPTQLSETTQAENRWEHAASKQPTSLENMFRTQPENIWEHAAPKQPQTDGKTFVAQPPNRWEHTATEQPPAAGKTFLTQTPNMWIPAPLNRPQTDGKTFLTHR